MGDFVGRRALGSDVVLHQGRNLIAAAVVRLVGACAAFGLLWLMFYEVLP